MLLSQSINISLSEAGVYALLGYAVVFFGLTLLMIVISLMSKCFCASQKKNETKTTNAPVQEIQPEPVKEAPGTAGSLKLYNVEPKTAALLMAIVADKMGKPINELRFISIKEVEQ